jgi:hypothetical protein
MLQKDQNCNDENLKELKLKFWWTIYQLTENFTSTIKFLLLCLSKFCILQGLIYLKNINIFGKQEPATASQLYRGYIYKLF